MAHPVVEPSATPPPQEVTPSIPAPWVGPRSHPASRILFGADGLRAGWSLLIYFVLISIIENVVNGGFRHFHHVTPDDLRHIARNPSDLLVTNGIPFAAVLAVTLLIARIERRPFRAYGMGPTGGAVRQFANGLFWGAALLSLLVAVLWGLHALVFDGRLLSGVAILRFALEWLVGFLFVGLFEEFLTRGFLYFTIARGIAGPLRYTRLAPYSQAIGFWATAALSSAFFGLGHLHNHGESLFGLISAGLLGLVYTVSLWRTGSLWWAIGMHTAWDWAQSFLYGTADSGHIVAFHLLGSHPQGPPLASGGLTGPEGSLYCIPVLALSAAVVVFTLRNTGRPVRGSNRKHSVV